jgi:hypothetical protein
MSARLRRRIPIAALGLCWLAVAVLPVRADVTIHGGDDRIRAHLQALIAAEMPVDQMSGANLAITVGAEALNEFCESGSGQPVLATYLYASRISAAAASCQQPVETIPVDPPLTVLYRLARALFPDSKSATLVSAAGAEGPARPYLQLPVPPEGVARGLGRLIQEGRWDVFLMPVDPEVFGGADYRLALETLFRHRKPVVVSIPSLLPQGAAAAAYYAPEQLEAALQKTLRHLVESGELLAGPPDRIQVKVNNFVLRNGYGRVITERDVLALEVEVNGGD